jgi:hypothetical protein
MSTFAAEFENNKGNDNISKQLLVVAQLKIKIIVRLIAAYL